MGKVIITEQENLEYYIVQIRSKHADGIYNVGYFKTLPEAEARLREVCRLDSHNLISAKVVKEFLRVQFYDDDEDVDGWESFEEYATFKIIDKAPRVASSGSMVDLPLDK